MRSRVFLVVVAAAVLAAAAPAVHAGSFRREELVVDGVTRELYVYTPEKLGPGRAPAVLAFHGFLSTASGLRWLAKVDAFADAAGFIVIYPNAVAKSWNAGRGSGSTNRTTDDVAFARALLAATLARPEVDPQRIYAMGFSNGAQMVATIVCKLEHPLLAAAMVAHSLNIPECEPRKRVPMLLIQGRKDPFVPFEGGGKLELASHQFTVDFFRRINQAVGPAKTVLALESITCTESVDRAGREQVLECTGERDGHTWPGAVVFQPELFGRTNSELAGTEFVFSFFSRHVEPAPRRGRQALVSTAPTSAAQKSTAAAAAPRPAPSSVSRAAPPPPAPEPSRWSARELTLGDGSVRRYYVPREGLGSARVLVLVFAERSLGPDLAAAALGRPSAALGYVIVEPELQASLERVVGQERRRAGRDFTIAVAGIGAGGGAAQRSYCERSELVSAVVLIAAAIKGPLCTPRPVPSLLSVQAARDSAAPAEGDAKRGLLAQRELLVHWRNANGIPLHPEGQAGPGYVCQSGRPPSGEPEIRTCRIDASEPTAPSGGLASTRVIADFLERHQSKPKPFTIVHAR